jgi:hypothetical protein
MLAKSLRTVSSPTLRWFGRNRGYQWEFKVIRRRTTSLLCCRYPYSAKRYNAFREIRDSTGSYPV